MKSCGETQCNNNFMKSGYGWQNQLGAGTGEMEAERKMMGFSMSTMYTAEMTLRRLYSWLKNYLRCSRFFGVFCILDWTKELMHSICAAMTRSCSRIKILGHINSPKPKHCQNPMLHQPKKSQNYT